MRVVSWLMLICFSDIFFVSKGEFVVLHRIYLSNHTLKHIHDILTDNQRTPPTPGGTSSLVTRCIEALHHDTSILSICEHRPYIYILILCVYMRLYLLHRRSARYNNPSTRNSRSAPPCKEGRLLKSGTERNIPFRFSPEAILHST